LIDDLLDTSRIATGKLHFEPVPSDLNASVRAALETVKEAAAGRRIELAANLHPAPLVVAGEPVRLQQIAWNLISNAIKFTEPGGTVTVATRTEGERAVFEVTDTGIGISPDFLPHVFDRFRQADGSTSRVHGGLGLGLAIAHALTKMHGGELVANSEGVGKGARFTLSVNFVPSLPADVEPEAKQRSSLNGMKVLIVEDSEDTLTLLSAIFGREGAHVMTASSANAALDSVKEKRPNLIVSDIGMPDTDGYEFLQRVKVLPGMNDVPAIAISGYASDEDRARALNVGYSALVPKPIDVDDLFGIIQGLFRPTVPASN
jgi:CheY-like chemotaxis protein